MATALLGVLLRVKAVQRAGRPTQRLQRGQHGMQRRRHAPAGVARRQLGTGLARKRDRRARCTSSRGGDDRARHRRQPAYALVRAARPSHEMRGHAARAAEVDAAGHARPRVAPAQFSRRHAYELPRSPVRDRCCAFRAAPGQRLQQPRVRTQQGREGRCQVVAMQVQRPSGCLGCVQRRGQCPAGRFKPPRGIQPREAVDTRVRASAELGQRRIQLGQLRRHALGERRPGRRQPPRQAPCGGPRRPARGQTFQHLLGFGHRRQPRYARHHRGLEGLERGQLPHAQVAPRLPRCRRRRLRGADHRHQQQHAEHHRQHGRAGRDGEIQQAARFALCGALRRALNHGRLPRAHPRSVPARGSPCSSPVKSCRSSRRGRSPR